MRVLVTGSSGHLGAALVARLRQTAGVSHVLGFDAIPSSDASKPTTDIVAQLEDRRTVERTVHDNNITAIAHCAALHKPQVATHSREAFLQGNVVGTQNLLEAATASEGQVDRFLYTSTTSLMVTDDLNRRGKDVLTSVAAEWMDETTSPLLPRNIYGVTKLASEHLCRLHHMLTDLPVTVLRTSRFFPEEDDKRHTRAQTISGTNQKVIELLSRRAHVDDMVTAHVLALQRPGSRTAPERSHFRTFVVSAPTPFTPSDCLELGSDAAKVIARYFPTAPELFARRGWVLPSRLDRVYVAHAIEQELGFEAQVTFQRALAAMEAGAGEDELGTLLDHRPAFRHVTDDWS